MTVITNEPSQDVTPLSNEPPAGIPEQAVRNEVQPAPSVKNDWLMPWLEVVVAFLIWLASFFLLAFTPLVIALPYLVNTWMKHGPPRPETLTTDKTLIVISLAGTIVAHLLTLGLLWFVVSRGGRLPFWKSISFQWPKNISPVIGTLVCFLFAAVLLVIGWALTTALGGSKTQLDLIVESSMVARFITALAAVATAPLIEELIYRGVLYSAIERAAGVGIAVAVVTLMFAGVHVFQYSNNIGVIAVITMLSLALTVIRAYSGSVVPPFIVHLVFNGIQSIVLVLAPFLDKSILEKGDQVTPTTPGFEIAIQSIDKIVIYLCRMT